MPNRFRIGDERMVPLFSEVFRSIRDKAVIRNTRSSTEKGLASPSSAYRGGGNFGRQQVCAEKVRTRNFTKLFSFLKDSYEIFFTF